MSTTALSRQEANTAIMTRLYDAFISADLTGALSLLSDKLVHHIQGSAWFSGDHSREGLIGVFIEIFQLSGATMEVEVITAAANDEYAFGVNKHRSERNGAPFETTVFITARIEDGKIVEAWECPFDVDELAAFYARG